MYFQSTRPMMYQDLIKEMKAGAYIYRTEGFRISLYGQGGIGQNS